MKFKKIFLAVLCSMFYLPAANAAEKTLSYNVYAGGIYAVTATLTLDISKTNYNANLEAGTRGFLKTLAPWEGVFTTTGWVQKNAFVPHIHKTTSGWKNEVDVKEYRYSPKGQFLGFKHIEDGTDKTTKNIDKALTQNTTDILSATLNVMTKVGNGEACAGASDVFDGKRRFKMLFRDQGPAQLKKTAHAFYEGPARACVIEIKPDGGAWNKKPRGWLSIQEQGRKAGTLPTIWMAKIPAFSVAVPVKIQVKTKYGTLFMHLAEIN